MVLQFAVSIGLGIAAAVVFSQISYARNIDLGFRRDNIIVMGSGRMTTEQRDAFAQVLRANPGVMDVGMTDRTPFRTGQNLVFVQPPGQADTVTLNGVDIDPDYPRVYSIKLVAGRELSETRGDDRMGSQMPGGDPLNEGRNILLNVAGAQRLGLTPQQAVGKTVLFNHNHVKIAGVLADAKVNGAREPINPTAYTYVPKAPMGLSVRLRPDTIPQTLAFIDKSWRAFSPIAGIDRSFLDESFNKLYQTR